GSPANFGYLPWARAAKLKKQIAEESKLKKALLKEKKKMGLVTEEVDKSVHEAEPLKAQRKVEKSSVQQPEEADEVVALDADRSVITVPRPETNRPRLPKERPQKQAQAHSPDVPASKSTSTPAPSSSKRGNRDAKPKSEQPVSESRADDSQPSFRDLKRAAYSRSSLHNFKHIPKMGVNHKPSREHQSRNRKGQPNMKLRMGVMLEQIKRSTGGA
ncbi:hypothetical protein FRB99_002154, partial [Tulasnella sp. 403]